MEIGSKELQEIVKHCDGKLPFYEVYREAISRSGWKIALKCYTKEILIPYYKKNIMDDLEKNKK